MKHLSKATACDGFGEKETIKWRNVGSVLSAQGDDFRTQILLAEIHFFQVASAEGHCAFAIETY
jgi:hypothetical protein